MYELVNTSLPNGLIAGTHGFATVAMTKGMPDSLRMRVEAYCAYSHRSSAHDATYFDENPVNWFHAILPQGEHIVGRVAPAEFDYTGRTNRLARLFVFSKGKMPLIGGVTVLLKKARRLQEPWSGEARWLDEDKETERLFRNEPVAATKDAPSWRKKFGDSEGLNYARGFARLLAKNVNGGGKPIYFKTSAAHDVSGGELLSLFADLINLLPTSARAGIAFSTYSAALPQGAVCHLRGVYDRDRAFDMAKVAQPWVDCENNTVHNASMLPAEEIEPPKPMPQSSGSKVITTDSRPRRTQYKNIEQYLPADRKKHDPLIWIFAAIAGVIVVGFVAFMLMMIISTKKSQPTAQDDNNAPAIRSLGEADATDSQKGNETVSVPNQFNQWCIDARAETEKDEWDTEKIKKLFNKLSKTPLGEVPSDFHSLTNRMKLFIEQERELEILSGRCKKELDNFNLIYESSDKLQQKLKKLEKLKAEIERVKSQLKHGLKFDEKLYKNICEYIERCERNQADEKARLRQKQDAVAFSNAISIIVRKQSGFDSEFKEGDKKRMTNGVIRVFYYDALGSLTNLLTGFVYHKVAKNYRIRPEPQDPCDPCILWYDAQKKVLYWDWAPLDNAKPLKWFEKQDKKDLTEICFGKEQAVLNTWMKHFKQTEFTIVYTTNNHEKTQSIKPNVTNVTLSGEISLNIDFFKPDSRELEQKIKDAKERQTKAGNALRQFEDKFKEWANMTNEVVQIEMEPYKLNAEIGKLNKKKDKEKKSDLEKKLQAAKEVRKDPNRNKQKELRDFTRTNFKIFMWAGDIIASIKECNKELMTRRANLEREFKNAQDEVTKAEDNKKDEEKNWRERIKQSEFRVTEVKGVSR